MKFYETNSEFIKLEENTPSPKHATIHEIHTGKVNKTDVVKIPSLELVLYSSGSHGRNMSVILNFLGFTFNIGFNTDSFESSLLEKLNYWKLGNHRHKILNYLQYRRSTNSDMEPYKTQSEFYGRMLDGLNSVIKKLEELELENSKLIKENETIRTKASTLVSNFEDLNASIDYFSPSR